MTEIITSSVKQTQNLAKKIAKDLRGGEVLALYGDLGAGKTAFVQGLARGLGIRRPVTSPTFVLIREYKAAVLKLYHIDLYRVSDKREIREIGLEEILKNKKAVVAIEWPEKIKSWLPKDRTIKIKFEWISEQVRRIIIEK
jgi:tRNA threonylcarbamoyladenosine biosynthesis protein TsaE